MSEPLEENSTDALFEQVEALGDIKGTNEMIELDDELQYLEQVKRLDHLHQEEKQELKSKLKYSEDLNDRYRQMLLEHGINPECVTKTFINVRNANDVTPRFDSDPGKSHQKALFDSPSDNPTHLKHAFGTPKPKIQQRKRVNIPSKILSCDAQPEPNILIQEIKVRNKGSSESNGTFSSSSRSASVTFGDAYTQSESSPLGSSNKQSISYSTVSTATTNVSSSSCRSPVSLGTSPCQLTPPDKPQQSPTFSKVSSSATGQLSQVSPLMKKRRKKIRVSVETPNSSSSNGTFEFEDEFDEENSDLCAYQEMQTQTLDSNIRNLKDNMEYGTFDPVNSISADIDATLAKAACFNYSPDLLFKKRLTMKGQREICRPVHVIDESVNDDDYEYSDDENDKLTVNKFAKLCETQKKKSKTTKRRPMSTATKNIYKSSPNNVLEKDYTHFSKGKGRVSYKLPKFEPIKDISLVSSMDTTSSATQSLTDSICDEPIAIKCSKKQRKRSNKKRDICYNDLSMSGLSFLYSSSSDDDSQSSIDITQLDGSTYGTLGQFHSPILSKITPSNTNFHVNNKYISYYNKKIDHINRCQPRVQRHPKCTHCGYRLRSNIGDSEKYKSYMKHLRCNYHRPANEILQEFTDYASVKLKEMEDIVSSRLSSSYKHGMTKRDLLDDIKARTVYELSQKHLHSSVLKDPNQRTLKAAKKDLVDAMRRHGELAVDAIHNLVERAARKIERSLFV